MKNVKKKKTVQGMWIFCNILHSLEFHTATWINEEFHLYTWSCMLVWVSSSAFFSKDITHTFLFCLHLVAAALFRSRNFRRRSSGSSSTTRLRRPPLAGGDCSVCVGCICWVAGDIWNRRHIGWSLLGSPGWHSVCLRNVQPLWHLENSP